MNNLNLSDLYKQYANKQYVATEHSSNNNGAAHHQHNNSISYGQRNTAQNNLGSAHANPRMANTGHKQNRAISLNNDALNNSFLEGPPANLN